MWIRIDADMNKCDYDRCGYGWMRILIVADTIDADTDRYGYG